MAALCFDLVHDTLNVFRMMHADDDIGAASVYFYDLCLRDPERFSAEDMTKALEGMVPEDYREWKEGGVPPEDDTF